MELLTNILTTIVSINNLIVFHTDLLMVVVCIIPLVKKG